MEIQTIEISKYKYNKELDNIPNLKNPKDFIQTKILELVKDIITVHHPIVTKDNDQMYLYYAGYYHIDGDKDIRTICGAYFGDYYATSHKDNIVERIKAVSTINREDFCESGTYINLMNGVLNIETLELLPHDYKYNFLYKIPINYNPDIKFDKLHKFLSEATSNNDDLLCLQEFIGYTLYPTYRLNDLDKFLIIFGKQGHNRKTKTCNLITKLLHDCNVSSSELQRLAEDKFECSMLYGKKANIRNDIPNTVLKTTGIIKNLVGSDKITAQRKNEKQFQFYNTAKLIFSCNELPEVKDSSYAWWTKVILLEFVNDFRHENSLIMEELTNEEGLTAALNFALEGLQRLIKNKTFTYNFDTTEERWNDGRLTKNPLSEFFNSRVIIDKQSKVTKANLYKEYTLWNNTPTQFTIRKFGDCIRTLNIEECRIGIDEAWNGIKINPISIMEQEVINIFRNYDEIGEQ